MTKAAQYREFSEAPSYQQAKADGDPRPSNDDRPKWSGSIPVPPVGAIVVAGVGPSEVIGYFVAEGWLGLLVKPYDPPESFVRKNGYDAVCHVFGAEIDDELLPEPPKLNRPSQPQLAALQRFADARGRKWKSFLSFEWLQDITDDDAGLLRQVRNQFGPTWLFSKDNPIRPSPKANRSSPSRSAAA